jgi:excisionase family DNA binding protein
MRRKRRTEITVETKEVIVLRLRTSSVRAWCEPCAEQVKMITVDEAAAVAEVTARTIYRWVETQRVHFTETPDGQLFICFNSLLELTKSGVE